jgi:hypothetical protein
MAAAILLVGASMAKAADLAVYTPIEEFDERFDPAWQVSIVPFYGWIPGIKGNVAVFGQSPARTNVTPTEIVENIDKFLEIVEGVYFGAGQVRRGKVGVAWDVIYLDVFSTKEIEGRFLSADLDVGFSQFTSTLLATYRLHETPITHLDAMAGVRINDIDLDVGVTLGPFGGSATEGDTWADVILGLKGRAYLSNRIYVEGWGMVGGFGLASEFVWDAYGAIGYQVRDWLSIFAGFRGTGTDYQNGAFKWDVIEYGPVLGFDLRF